MKKNFKRPIILILGILSIIYLVIGILMEDFLLIIMSAIFFIIREEIIFKYIIGWLKEEIENLDGEIGGYTINLD